MRSSRAMEKEFLWRRWVSKARAGSCNPHLHSFALYLLDHLFRCFRIRDDQFNALKRTKCGKSDLVPLAIVNDRNDLFRDLHDGSFEFNFLTVHISQSLAEGKSFCSNKGHLDMDLL